VIGISEAGIRETIDDGINGILVERDKIKFAEAIQNLIADQTLWEKLRLNGISNINSNWTWDATNLRLQNHLEESIKVYLSC
jgi:glycosyltransferase involved in cell wall biosynthesis